MKAQIAMALPINSTMPYVLREQEASKSKLQPEDIHVLLVDDERLSRTVVANLLRKCNYKGKIGAFSHC